MAGMKEDEEELSKTLQSMVINTERIWILNFICNVKKRKKELNNSQSTKFSK